MQRDKDEDFIRHDCRDRISKLEALLIASSQEKDNMRQTILTAITGESLLTIAGAAEIPPTDEIQNVGQLVIQLIIGIITIWKLVKKPKK
jgi:hypothetical protein